MSKLCDICGRSSQAGYKVSHSNIKTLRKFQINLQMKKIDGKKKRVCTKCLKKMTRTAKK